MKDMNDQNSNKIDKKEKKKVSGCFKFFLVGLFLMALIIFALLSILRPSVTPAEKYLAGAVPSIANMRVQIQLFQTQFAHLPGIMTEDGRLVEAYTGLDVTTGESFRYAKSSLLNDVNDQHIVQSMIFFTNVVISGTNVLDCSEDGRSSKNHVFNELDMNFGDLTGAHVKPCNFQYVVMGSKSNSCLYAIGCFGSDENFLAGCGYAVAEFNDIENDRNFVATFERYKPRCKTQLLFGNQQDCGIGVSEIKIESDADAVCYLPPFTDLYNQDQEHFDAAIKEMKLAGWEFH